MMIQVVERTFDILEMLARKNRPMSNMDIAAEMDISIQSANNLLRTLYNRGYVTQDDSRCYLLGAQCFFLGSFADRWSRLRQRVAGTLKRLAKESGLSGFVGVIENDRLLGIALAQAGGDHLVAPPQQWWDELHSTACGRVLLAALPTAERSRLFARTIRRKVTGQTVVDIETLERICRQAAADGYAEVRDESRIGVSSLAVPLRGVDGKAFAALAVSGANSSWTVQSAEFRLTLLREAVDGLEMS